MSDYRMISIADVYKCGFEAMMSAQQPFDDDSISAEILSYIDGVAKVVDLIVEFVDAADAAPEKIEVPEKQENCIELNQKWRPATVLPDMYADDINEDGVQILSSEQLYIIDDLGIMWRGFCMETNDQTNPRWKNLDHKEIKARCWMLQSEVQ